MAEETFFSRAVHAVGSAVGLLRHTFNVISVIVAILVALGMLIVLVVGAAVAVDGNASGWVLLGAGAVIFAICAVLLYFFWKDINEQLQTVQLLEKSPEELKQYFLQQLREKLEAQGLLPSSQGGGQSQQQPGAGPLTQQYSGFQFVPPTQQQHPQHPQQQWQAQPYTGPPPHQQQQYQQGSRAFSGPGQTYGATTAAQPLSGGGAVVAPDALYPGQQGPAGTPQGQPEGASGSLMQSATTYVLTESGLDPQLGNITPAQFRQYVEEWLRTKLQGVPDAFMRNLLYSLVGIPGILLAAGVALSIVGSQDDNEVDGHSLEPLQWLGIALVVVGFCGLVVGACAYLSLKWTVGRMLDELVDDAAKSVQEWVLSESST